MKVAADDADGVGNDHYSTAENSSSHCVAVLLLDLEWQLLLHANVCWSASLVICRPKICDGMSCVKFTCADTDV